MTDRARISINLSQSALEIEGSEAFVNAHADKIKDLLEKLLNRPVSSPSSADMPLPSGMAAPMPQHAAVPSPMPDFPVYLNTLDLAATDVERMLAAGFWLQSQAGDDAFSTGEASRILQDNGHKPGNPSQCVKQSLNARNLFITQKGRYRVSRKGRERLRQLMGTIIPDS